MIEIKNAVDCCGCTAYANICAHDAITMEPDALGFLYPKVNKDKCTDCRLCEKVCAFNNAYDISLNIEKPLTFGARHKDITEVETSRSGAAFIALSDYILEKGGVIYGVGYVDHFRVVHKRAVNKEERDEFKGSKYVQSDLTGVFRQVKDDLKKGMLVLFSGTPCQTAGLHSYVGRRLRENLFLVGIVCHAVPSPYIWRDYLAAIEKKYKNRVIELTFRDKTFGWSAAHNERFVFSHRKDVIDFTNRDLFYKCLSTRYSCHSCHYCNMRRPSDVTIGDFWGYRETKAKSLNHDDKGLSLLIINTPKGQSILGYLRKNMNLLEVENKEILQPNLMFPTQISPLHKKFEEDYIGKGFHYVAKKYSNWSMRYKFVYFVKDKLYRIRLKLRKIKRKMLA